MDELDDMIETGIKGYVFYRLLLASIVFLVLMLAGVGFIVCWIYREIALEARYYHQYGSSWRVEYEKYQGSLSHAHAQIAIAVGGMVAIAGVLGFAICRMFRKHRHASHRIRSQKRVLES